MNKWQLALEYDKIIRQITGYCAFSLSREIIEQLTPIHNERYIIRENKKTQDAINYILAGNDTSFSGVSDVSSAIIKASKNATCTIEEMVKLNRVNHVVARLIKADRSADAFYVYDYIESLAISPHLLSRIDQSFSSNYDVLDSASKEYASLKKQVNDLEKGMHTQVQGFINKHTSWLSEPISMTRYDRVVVLAKAADKNKFKGIVHGESASGQSAYVEPPFLIELNNKKESLKSQINDEIERICIEISFLISQESRQLLANLETLAILDSIFAKAKWGLDRNGFVASVAHENTLFFENARHPLIEPKEVVANTIEIEKSKRALLITGPNTGGKTVTVKIIGLFTLLAYSGVPVLASKSSLPVFDQVFADIGDDQSIVQSLSTFSSHLSKISEILSLASEHSLVIFDELGSGTDPDEGESLAIAILEYCEQINCMVVATTHFNRLKEIAYEKENTMLASVEFDIKSLRPTYRFLSNSSGSSNALAIASRYNMPASLIEKAKTYYQRKKSEQQKLIDDLQEKIVVQEALNKEIEQSKRVVEELKSALQQEKSKFEAQKEALMSQVEKQAQVYLQEKIDEMDEIVKDAIVADQKNAKEKLEQLQEMVEQLEVEEIDVTIEVDDYVQIRSTHQIGAVTSINNNQLEIQVNQKTFKVKKEDVFKVEKPVVRKKVKTKTSSMSFKNVPMECVIVGLRSEEAKVKVDQYINDCILANRHQGFIVHGIGTGVLKKVINEYVKKHPGVKKVTPADHGQGGAAVTVVSFQ